MFRYFLINTFFLLLLPILCIGNNNLNEKVAKLKIEIFEIAFSFTEMNHEYNSKMRNLFEKQIANKENFMKIFVEINEKKHVILTELSEKIEPKMVNMKAKMTVENLKTNLQSLNDPFLMVNPAGILEILKSEYSILQKIGIIAQRGTKSGLTKGNENKNEIGQKMVELEKLVNSLTEQIQILVNSKLNGLGFAEMAWQYWLLFLMGKLVEDGLRLLNGLLEIEAEPADLAYGQIGRHLDWLKGKIGVERENIAINQEMAKKLAKMEEIEIHSEIFNDLAGRLFSDKQELDKKEWKLFVLIGKILDLYYSDEKEKREQKLKRKRVEGNNSDSNGSKIQRLSEKENKLEKILENAPIFVHKNKFPQYFTDILLTNGLIDSVKSIESLVEHQKFMVEKLGQYDAEWQNDEIIFNEFEKKITETGDLLEEAIKGIMEEMEMRQILLPKAIEELEKIINKLRVFLHGDRTEFLVKKQNATVMINNLEYIFKILGKEKSGHILRGKFYNFNLQKLGEMKILDGRLGILQKLIVEFEYFLTRGQKLWKKLGNNAAGNVGQAKEIKQKNIVVPTNSANVEVINEILGEEMKILKWMEKLEEIGLVAIELHISIQKWHLKSRDPRPRLRLNTKEKLTKLMKFFNYKMEIVGAGERWENILTELEDMNEKGVRMEYLERKRLESAVKKLINYEKFYTIFQGIKL